MTEIHSESFVNKSQKMKLSDSTNDRKQSGLSFVVGPVVKRRSMFKKSGEKSQRA